MTSDPRLERYLTSLERVLRPFPVSDRAEIVTEIKSHVLSALERDPQTRLDTVLSALGEPETVANRYLIERGLKPTKPPISPVVKWVVIGFLGTFAMILAFLGVVLMRFAPLLHVDGEDSNVWFWGKNSSFSGSSSVAQGQSIFVKFGNGKFEFTNSKDSKLSWDCNSHGSGTSTPEPVIDKNGLVFDLTALKAVKCELSVPENAKLVINGSNGKLEFDEPHYNLALNLSNGKVDLSPDQGRAYRYELAVTNGRVDSFTSSNQADAYSIAIQLVNGKISRGK